MSTPNVPQTKVNLLESPEYREQYANSVQVRMSVWDFMLVFGTLQPTSSPDEVNIKNQQGIYLSPQQAKALADMLVQNVQQYEAAFGEIQLEPKNGIAPSGPVH